MPRKVLFLTHHPPYPASSGDAVRNWNLMRQLAERGWEVSLFTLAEEGCLPPDCRDGLNQVCERVVVVPLNLNRKERLLRVAKASLLRRAFQFEYFWEPAAAQTLREELAEHDYDILMVQLLYMLAYVPIEWRDRSILDTHNSEFLRMASMAHASGLSLRGLAARLQMSPSRLAESAAGRGVARVIAVSAQEQQYFETQTGRRVALLPNGAPVIKEAPRPAPGSSELLFIGSLDYSANVSGVGFLLHEVLPKLSQYPERVTILGRNPPKGLVKQALKAVVPVNILGYVESVEPYYQTAGLMVVPILFGGGTRLKILEAMAHGLPVVSTTIGCEGLEVLHNEHLLVADSAVEFAAAIERLLSDDGLADHLARSALDLVRSRYDWQAIGADLDSVLSQLLDDPVNLP